MAATDQTYRNQKGLDIFFGVSCVLMLISVIGMFAQDYYREFKVEQRDFRDVEEGLAERGALRLLPDPADVNKALGDVKDADKVEKNEKKDQLVAVQRRIDEWTPKKVKSETSYQSTKADFDSTVSIYNIAIEERGPESPQARELRKQVDDLKAKLDEKLRIYEEAKTELDKAQKEQEALRKPLTDSLARLEKMNGDFDRFAKNAVLKRWKIGDAFRNLPVVDAFASPTRIQQFTLNDLPINYSFKYVTRYDRCTTCHQGIDRPAYDKKSLRDLTQAPDELNQKLDAARQMLSERQKVLESANEKLSFDPSYLELRTVQLDKGRVNEYCVHPRLDLFVDGNSHHPMEKFGCSICHQGQGSATQFSLASHSPNDAVEKSRWEKDHQWESNHYWDYPMIPNRFVESSCLQCHHQVTDLLPEGNKVEMREGAPVDSPGTKVVRGYNMVRENGCFGCHEISGVKGGREVGPDLRLEPSPPVSDLSPSERVKVLSDPLNPPGTLRKVGPSLRRITEKTNEDWVRKWILAPRGFRPDTRMPHFYNLSNNNKEVLQGTGQEEFPAAEINSMTYYLFQASRQFLKNVEILHKEGEDKGQADQKLFESLRDKIVLTAAEKKDLEEVIKRIRIRSAAPPITEPKLPPGYKEDKARGRQLFSERGCLACHRHEGTSKENMGQPAVSSDAHYGPNLSLVAAKLGVKPGEKASARRWLIQWIKDPKVHHPRTYMPVTHLEDDQASDIAAWLLDQPSNWQGPEVQSSNAKALENLARVYLNKAFTRREVDDLFAGGLSAEKLQQILDPEDRDLGSSLDAEGKIKFYIGKKSISQLGCFGCHDIPGFETSKPIGTPLNDWGRKDPERLAFEDIDAFVKEHYYAVEKETDDEGHGHALKENKEPYEKFYTEALEHRHRDGFLHQKLREPRSYDHNRIRAWDERLRMPQFKFARGQSEPKEKESPEQAQNRAEAKARESVMTFVLGLVAEPVPLKYVYDPAPDRMAIVKGKQVLDKFNCGGCHLYREGSYDFPNNPSMVEQLEGFYTTAQSNAPSDYVFPDHNAWVGQLPTRPDRFTAHGIGRQESEEAQGFIVRLTEALRFTNSEKKVVDIPAANSIGLTTKELLARSDPDGGAFANLMVDYLTKKDPQRYKKAPNGDSSDARASLPPPLLREGEKVQPSWLFQFLRNPYAIRPLTILRMPRFNMSDEDAMALVNYFAALDKLKNPGFGLNYPYSAIPQRDETFWTKRSSEYEMQLKKTKQYDKRVAELQPFWDWLLKENTADLESKVANAQKSLKEAKPEDKKSAENFLASLQKDLKTVKDGGKDKTGAFFQHQLEEWKEKDAYAIDAYRLLSSYNTPCLSCHQIGNLPAKQSQGPPLQLAWERLRPEWTLRWIANPDRLMSYPTPMPQNFPRDKPPYPEFAGSPLEQVKAAHDVLMALPQVADLPANRYQRTAPGK